MSYLELYCDLRQARLDHGYSREELSKMTGISLLTIKEVEEGKFIPTVRVAILLSYALDCRVEDLFWFVTGEDDLNV